jgi:hypothetical protein
MFDYISRNWFVSRYSYHHGYYGGVERKFNGFGMVEQWDIEELGTLSSSTQFPDPANIDEVYSLPPIHTKSWYQPLCVAPGSFLSRREALPRQWNLLVS